VENNSRLSSYLYYRMDW